MSSKKENDLSSFLKTIADEISGGVKRTNKLSEAFIFRVPSDLRELNKSAYSPRLISIGPLHSNEEHLNPRMQDIKRSYVSSLFSEMSGNSSDAAKDMLNKCLEAMKELIKDAKKCYAEEVGELNEKMMLIDGCFILELLRRYSIFIEKNSEESLHIREDPIFGSIWTLSTVQHDLLLVENQLPFSVLEKLFDHTLGRPPSPSLCSYLLKFFRKLIEPSCTDHKMTTNCCPSGHECVLPIFCNKKKDEGEVSSTPHKEDTYHILHLLHNHFLPPKEQRPPPFMEYPPSKFLHSASDLDYAGVKFVAGTAENLFEIKFNERDGPFWWLRRARLEIPLLCINNYTERFFRNLIAFEQCCPGVSPYVTSYAFLMDRLINTEEDVQVLQKAGVIHNYLGANKEVSEVFNKFCKEVDLREFYFSETCNKVAVYSKHHWPAAIAYLRHKYFSNPWTFIAFCAAFIAFGMSVTQFIRSFLR